jgi:hypothetical protein
MVIDMEQGKMIPVDQQDGPYVTVHPGGPDAGVGGLGDAFQIEAGTSGVVGQFDQQVENLPPH